MSHSSLLSLPTHFILACSRKSSLVLFYSWHLPPQFLLTCPTIYNQFSDQKLVKKRKKIHVVRSVAKLSVCRHYKPIPRQDGQKRHVTEHCTVKKLSSSSEGTWWHKLSQRGKPQFCVHTTDHRPVWSGSCSCPLCSTLKPSLRYCQAMTHELFPKSPCFFNSILALQVLTCSMNH